MQKIYLETSKGDFFKALIQDHEMLSFFFYLFTDYRLKRRVTREISLLKLFVICPVQFHPHLISLMLEIKQRQALLLNGRSVSQNISYSYLIHTYKF